MWPSSHVSGMQSLQGNQTLRDESEKPPATNAPSADIDAQFRLQTPIPPITACCQQAFNSTACECPQQNCLILQRHVLKIQNGADGAAVCFKSSHMRETKIAEHGKKKGYAVQQWIWPIVSVDKTIEANWWQCIAPKTSSISKILQNLPLSFFSPVGDRAPIKCSFKMLETSLEIMFQWPRTQNGSN